jgi:hypothetical protein
VEDLGLDTAAAAGWFRIRAEQPFVLVEIQGEQAKLWATELREAVRRCYIADSLIIAKAREHNAPPGMIVGAKLPDPSATMSGDFGEILVYIYQATTSHPGKLIGPKKWRLKQDRTKAAPYSDVVQFHLPEWPAASTTDAIFCSEVKTKATKSDFTPIADALADSARDQASRLAKTLVWLRDRALTDDMGSVHLTQLARFIDATEWPPFTKHFQAVAVICSTLAQAELAAAPHVPPGTSLIVVIVPDLKATYTAVFEAARTSLPAGCCT